MSAPDAAAMNAALIEKLLAEPAQHPAEGGLALRVVRTRGRRSGRPRSTPLGVVRVDGMLYLVSPDRTRDWCRNVDAEPAVTLDPGGDALTACRVPPAEAAAAVSAYLAATRVPWALRAFPVAPGASTEEITAHLDTIAVYRLDPG